MENYLCGESNLITYPIPGKIPLKNTHGTRKYGPEVFFLQVFFPITFNTTRFQLKFVDNTTDLYLLLPMLPILGEILKMGRLLKRLSPRRSFVKEEGK